MPVNSAPFPPSPEDKGSDAKLTYNIENLYLGFGDHFSKIFAGIDFERLDASGEKPTSLLSLLALVTIFQYAERLPDRLAADAVRTRMDWKYALRLGVTYPGFDPLFLFEFRQRLLHNGEGQMVFYEMLKRTVDYGLFGVSYQESRDSRHVLRFIDNLSWLDRAFEYFLQALETLAAVRPDWLRKFALPHWYQHYNPQGSVGLLPGDETEQYAMIRALRGDIVYLLNAVDESGQEDLKSLSELETLHRFWKSWQVAIDENTYGS